MLLVSTRQTRQVLAFHILLATWVFILNLKIIHINYLCRHISEAALLFGSSVKAPDSNNCQYYGEHLKKSSI